MMTFKEKLTAFFEKHFTIPHLALILTLGSGLSFVFAMISPGFLPFIAFIPERVIAGEYWRLASFIFYPFDMHPIFAFFTYYLFFLMGTALEQRWGAARFNAFIFLGYLLTILFAFLTPLYPVTNYYLYLTVYLAFAALHPDFELYLFFVFPVKIKWLAWFVVGLTALDFLGADWSGRFAILAAMANFLVFFGAGFFRGGVQAIQILRTETIAVQEESKPFHLCSVCGMTEKNDPNAEFRMKNGVEYCLNHLPQV